MNDTAVLTPAAGPEPIEPEPGRHETLRQRAARGGEREGYDGEWEQVCTAISRERAANAAKRGARSI